MDEVQGQAGAQPSVEEMAASVAKGLLSQEEGPPRDETGKFAPTKPQAPQEPEAEAAPQEEEAPAEEAPPEIDWEQIKGLKRKVKVEAEDGSDEEVELALEEMEKGVMLERSYRQKTAQLAREREAVHAKVKEAIEPKLKEYDEKLQIAEQVIWHTLAPQIKGIDWNKLAAENPAEWAQKYQQVQNVNAQLAHVQAERKRIADANEAQFKEAQKKAAQEALDTLQREIPKWDNNLYTQILNTGKEYGFKAEEVNAITDPRAIKVLHDAMQFRALKAKPVVDKRVAPQAPKVAKPGSTEKPDAGSEKWNQSMGKLKKSGRTEDAVELAKLMLARESR